MIVNVTLMVFMAIAVQPRDDSAALFQGLKTRLAPEIDRFERDSANVGPPSPVDFYSADIVRAMLESERDRFLALFTDLRLRPLRLSVEARFARAIAEAEAHAVVPQKFKTKIGGGSVFDYPEHSPDAFVVSLVSGIVSYLKRILTLPSLVEDVTVQSQPSGAHVTFSIGKNQDQEREFDTPGVAQKLFLGRYLFMVRREQYQERALEIDLLDETISIISCNLQKNGERVGTTCQFR